MQGFLTPICVDCAPCISCLRGKTRNVYCGLLSWRLYILLSAFRISSKFRHHRRYARFYLLNSNFGRTKKWQSRFISPDFNSRKYGTVNYCPLHYHCSKDHFSIQCRPTLQSFRTRLFELTHDLFDEHCALICWTIF